MNKFTETYKRYWPVSRAEIREALDAGDTPDAFKNVRGVVFIPGDTNALSDSIITFIEKKRGLESGRLAQYQRGEIMLTLYA